MFDHTIEGINQLHPNMIWKKEGLASYQNKDERLDTIENHLLEYGIEKENFLLKMDIEGAEFDVFESLSPKLLTRVDQIFIEVHGIGRLTNLDFREKFFRVFSKINSQFTLCHVHANNFDGSDEFAFIESMVVPKLLELT